ncbi:MAG: hypothetical protein CMJ35_02810 [Phycisphaerae bacterium]|nr:hypothetical protein [Phycisphaerae bacterium]MBM90530.1 hypothetical protein [Phycisphaerae bacterium]HCT44558.1 hypothetical protein [Phycisphaerales bacterium]
MRINTIIVLSLFVLTALLSTGCADLQGAIAQTSAWRDEAVTVRDTLEKQVQTLQTQQGGLEPGSSEAIAIDTEIKLAQAKRAALDAAIAQANQVLDEAQHPSDALTQIAHGISSWVPAPAQGPLVLGAALIATLTRSRQLKQSSMSIINSISHVLERDEQFKSLFEQHADTIRSIQTPTARKLVDQTNRKRAQAA